MHRWILLAHIIAAMVFFGLPFTFGRWFSSAAGHGSLKATLSRLELYVFFHLNLCAALTAATGLWLAFSGGWARQTWIALAGVLWVLSVLNVNLNLGLALKTQGRALAAASAVPAAQKALRLRIALFSAIHHTFASLSIALMVFKPGL